MTQYAKKSEAIEAIQYVPGEKSDSGLEVVVYSEVWDDGKRLCSRCGQELSLHGVEEREAGKGTICPHSWKVTHEDGRIEWLGDAAFKVRYEAVKD